MSGTYSFAPFQQCSSVTQLRINSSRKILFPKQMSWTLTLSDIQFDLAPKSNIPPRFYLRCCIPTSHKFLKELGRVVFVEIVPNQLITTDPNTSVGASYFAHAVDKLGLRFPCHALHTLHANPLTTNADHNHFLLRYSIRSLRSMPWSNTEDLIIQFFRHGILYNQCYLWRKSIE